MKRISQVHTITQRCERSFRMDTRSRKSWPGWSGLQPGTGWRVPADGALLCLLYSRDLAATHPVRCLPAAGKADEKSGVFRPQALLPSSDRVTTCPGGGSVPEHVLTVFAQAFGRVPSRLNRAACSGWLKSSQRQ